MFSGLAQAERQSALERLGMASRHELVFVRTTFGLRALRGQQVTEAGRAAHELSASGQLEALGNGLLGLLHGESGPKQRSARPL